VLRDLEFAPSTYYASKTRLPSARVVQDAELIEHLKVVHVANLDVTAPARSTRP
jgi:hypothetical protein